MTTFTKYSSIENHYNQSFLDKVSREIDGNMKWIATEKIHGTNFQVVITEDSIEYGKRTSMLSWEENFFGYQGVVKGMEFIFQDIRQSVEDTVRLFGELAGDGIQSNTPYGDKDFYVFDVMVGDKLLDPLDAIDFCYSFGLKIAPIIKIGDVNELLELNPEYKSVTPKLSKIYDSEDNTDKIEFTVAGEGTSEGYVIKPLVNSYLKNGSRVIIKLKSASHTEKKSVKKAKVRKEIDGKDQEIIDTLSQYITPARIRNVLSHGEVELTDKTFGKVAGLTLKDILTEQARENDGKNLMQETFDPSFVNKTLVGMIIKEVVKIYQGEQK